MSIRSDLIALINSKLEDSGHNTAAELRDVLVSVVDELANADDSNFTTDDELAAHTSRVDNPHAVTKAQVGLSAVENTADADKPVSTAQTTYIDTQDSGIYASAQSYADGAANAVASDLTDHISDDNNPHDVTKAQVGLAAVENTADADKPVSTAQQTALNLKATVTSVSTHVADAANPHAVTKAQVGLGSADNTSDAGKPVSTATQTALNLKADASTTTAALALKADAAATTSALALKANTTDVAASFAALQIPSAGGYRVMGFGDSFINNAFAADGGAGYPASTTVGILTLLEAMSLGRFRHDYANSKGVAGNTTTQMLARYATDVAANYANFDVLYVSGGRNDGQTALSDATTTVSNLSSICDLAVAAGKKVLLEIPNPPRSFSITTDNQRKVRSRVNERMRYYARNKPGVTFIDFWRDWVDPTVATGVPASGITTDGMHPDLTGAIRAARRIIEQVGFTYYYQPKNQSAWDWYDASLNPSGNLLALRSTSVMRMAGTGGSATSPMSGSVATGFTLARDAGTGTEVVASKEAAVAGYDATGGDRQVITVSTLSNSVVFSLTTDINGAPSAALQTLVYAEVEIEMSGMVGNTNCALYVQYWNGSANRNCVALSNGSGGVIPWPDGKYLFRTPPITVTSNAQNLQLLVNCAFNAGGAGVIKIGAPVLRIGA